MNATEPRTPPCYVLTLDAPGGTRYASASSQLAHLGIEAVFVNGIPLDERETADLYSPLWNLLCMKRAMTPGEVSVYLGHRKIWQQLVTDGHERALVLEDDFFVQDERQFLHAIHDACSVANHWDIVKLFDYRHKRPIQRWRVNQSELVLFRYASSGCVAYLINAETATRLLKQQLIYRPIDEDWSHPWERNLRILSVDPNPVIEIAPELGGSLLEAERQQTKALHRNWGRKLYGNVLALNKAVRSIRWKRRMARQLMPEHRIENLDGRPRSR